MSRISKKLVANSSKPIDKYWKQIRSNIKNTVRGSSSLEDLEDLDLPDPKIVMNDYDDSDWKNNCQSKISKTKRIPKKIFVDEED